eukprot:268945_1
MGITNSSWDEIHARRKRDVDFVFLRACNNFNSNEKNAMLLVYGLIRNEFNDPHFSVDNLPSDIVQFIGDFCYDMSAMPAAKDTVRNGTGDGTIIESTGEETNIRCQYEMCHMEFRKIWKIKILHSVDEYIDLKIGIHETRPGKAKTETHTQLETIGDVKEGDVVTVLLLWDNVDESITQQEREISLRYSNSEITPLLAFAINGKLFKQLRIHETIGWCNLILNVRESVKLQLLRM